MDEQKKADPDRHDPEPLNARDQALLDFCEDVTAVLAYQPDIPVAHKESLGEKLGKLKDALTF